jgi:hypothetical protein
MMTLYQVTIRWIKTESEPERIAPAFDGLGKWARLNVYSWFVWSEFNSQQIYSSIARYLHADDSIVVVAVHPETAAGWAPGWFWQWIKTQGQVGPS